MRLKPTILAATIAILASSTSMSFAADDNSYFSNNKSKTVDKIQVKDKLAKREQKRKLHKKRGHKGYMFKMLRGLNNINAKDIAIRDISLKFKGLTLSFEDLYINQMIINNKQHLIDNKFDYLKIEISKNGVKRLERSDLDGKDGVASKKDIENFNKKFVKLFPIILKDGKHYHNYKRDKYLWFGYSKANTESIKFGDTLFLGDVQLKTMAKNKGNRVLYGLDLNIEKIGSNKYKAGPFSLEVSVNLDKKALVKVVKISKRMKSKHHKSLDAAKKARLKKRSDKAFANLVLQGVQLKINNFSYEKNGESLKIKALVNVPKYTGDRNIASNLIVKSIIEKTTVNINIKVSKKLIIDTAKGIAKMYYKNQDKKVKVDRHSRQKDIKSVSAMVSGLIGVAEAQGFITRQGDSYVSNIVLKDGKLRINGHLIDMDSSKKKLQGSIKDTSVFKKH